MAMHMPTRPILYYYWCIVIYKYYCGFNLAIIIIYNNIIVINY